MCRFDNHTRNNTTQAWCNMSANFTTASTMAYSDKELLPIAIEFTLTSCYVVIGALGLFGNCGIVFLFITKRVKTTPFKLLLLNLSLADLLASLTIWPYVFVDLKSLRGMSQTSSNLACTLTMGQTPFWLATCASTFTLALISINRYLHVCNPRVAQRFNNRTVSMIIIGLVWPTAIAIVTPNFISFEYDYKHAVCLRKWPPGFVAPVFSIMTSFLGYIIPMCTMIFTFFATKKYFWSRRHGTASRSTERVRRNRRMAVFMVALILAYFICWTPFFAYWVLSRAMPFVFPNGIDGEYARMRVIRFVLLMALCNSMANPIIYGLRGNAEFKKSFKAFLACIFCRNNATANENETEQGTNHMTSRA